MNREVEGALPRAGNELSKEMEGYFEDRLLNNYQDEMGINYSRKMNKIFISQL